MLRLCPIEGLLQKVSAPAVNRKQTARKSTTAWWAPFVDCAKPEEAQTEVQTEVHKQTARKSTTPRLPAPTRDLA